MSLFVFIFLAGIVFFIAIMGIYSVVKNGKDKHSGPVNEETSEKSSSKKFEPKQYYPYIT